MAIQEKLVRQIATSLEKNLSDLRSQGLLEAIGDNVGKVSTMRFDRALHAVYNHHIVIPDTNGSTIAAQFEVWANRNFFNYHFDAVGYDGYIVSTKSFRDNRQGQAFEESILTDTYWDETIRIDLASFFDTIRKNSDALISANIVTN